MPTLTLFSLSSPFLLVCLFFAKVLANMGRLGSVNCTFWNRSIIKQKKKKLPEVLRFPWRPTFQSPTLGILPSDGAGFYQSNFQTQMTSPLSFGHQQALEPRPTPHPPITEPAHSTEGRGPLDLWIFQVVCRGLLIIGGMTPDIVEMKALVLSSLSRERKRA